MTHEESSTVQWTLQPKAFPYLAIMLPLIQKPYASVRTFVKRRVHTRQSISWRSSVTRLSVVKLTHVNLTVMMSSDQSMESMNPPEPDTCSASMGMVL